MTNRHAPLSFRELQESDIELINNYWHNSDKTFLEGMGVDVAKMVSRDDFREFLLKQLRTPPAEKAAYALIWLENGEPVGHNNVNNIVIGKSASMHLHLWQPNLRRKGIGEQLLRLTLPKFFEVFDLQVLVCEPYALNEAPNRVLEKLGFRFIREYECIPGGHCFRQNVKRWELHRETLTRLIN
jgi:RimJ/RimL family protein N-acetyltransferase